MGVHRLLSRSGSGAAILAGDVHARLERAGHSIGVKDALIAGVCRRFDLPLATRNVRHFERVRGLRLLPVADQPSS